MTVKCCMCGNIRREGSWSAPDGASAADEMVSHGYCPPCASEFMREIDRDGSDLHNAVTLYSAWNIERGASQLPKEIHE